MAVPPTPAVLDALPPTITSLPFSVAPPRPEIGVVGQSPTPKMVQAVETAWATIKGHTSRLPAISHVRLNRPLINQRIRDLRPLDSVSGDMEADVEAWGRRVREKLAAEEAEVRMDEREDARRDEAATSGVALFAHPA